MSRSRDPKRERARGAARREPTARSTPRGDKKDTPQPIADVINQFLSRSGLAPKVEAASVISDWGELVGPQIAAVTEPLRVSEGVLFVAVDTSAWMMELNLMKNELLARLNAGKREGKIQQIVFVMGS